MPPAVSNPARSDTGSAKPSARPSPEPPAPALQYLYVDFNSYFASVEQQLRPELRGRPIAVLPVMVDTTCCIAASYEAKRFGVKTGTGVANARRMCPDLILVEARPSLYIEMHHRLVAAVESCTPVERIHSIDEMACRLMGSDRQQARAATLGRTIKRTIAEKVGSELRCSIGIAPNRFLAKTASNMQKPDGLVVITANDLPNCLYRLELRDLHGIGPAMQRRLNAAGIVTVQQLWALTRDEMLTIWGGIEGARYWSKLHGEVMPEVPAARATVGHSHVLPPELRTPQAALSVLHRLTQKAAMRLRSYGCTAGALAISVRFLSKSPATARWGAEQRLDPTNDTRMLLAALDRVWQDFPKRCPRPLAVGVTLHRLASAEGQTYALFDHGDQHHALNAAIDSLNLRYGKNTIYFGGAHASLGAAPMRIAFTHIPDLTTEYDE